MFSPINDSGQSEKRNVLILGGTRFIGKALALRLSTEKFNLVISSRRKISEDTNVTQITCERSSISNFISNFSSFDYVIDFTGYSVADIKGFPSGNPKCSYIFISTEWIESYIREKGKHRHFNHANLQYIQNKMELELSIRKRYGSICQIIRLPKILGTNDHHYRLNFYAIRASTNPCQIVRNDEYEISFLWAEDFVDAIESLLEGSLPLAERSTFVSSPENYRTLMNRFNAIFAPSSRRVCYHSFSESNITESLYFFAETDPLFLERLYPHENIRRIQKRFLDEDFKEIKAKFELNNFPKRELFDTALYLEREFLRHAH